MMADFDDALARDTPQFFFHLGDVIYNFGEAQYCYDQFYDPYRNYPNPILALAGNHDGMIAPDTSATTSMPSPDDSVTVDLATLTLGIYRQAPAGADPAPSLEGVMSPLAGGEAGK